MEYLRNNAETTLDGAINNSVTSLVVDSATPFPTTGNFRIIVEDEIMKVTGVSGTTFTVARGQESTTAASHADGVKITLVMTEDGVKSYMGDYITSGLTSALPASEKSGRLYLPDDSQVIFRDNGSTWDAYGPLWKMWTPNDTGYSWGNQQSASLTVRNDGLLLTSGTAGASAWTIRGRLKTRASTATGYKLTVGMLSLLTPANYAMAGIGLYESGTTRCEHIICESDSGVVQARVVKTTALQAGTTTNLGTTCRMGYQGSFPLVHWMQIEQTSTNLIYRYSVNRYDWFDLYSASITSFFSASPGEFLLNVLPYSQTCSALFLSVREET